MRGICFTEREVVATLEGRKSIFWRPVKPQPVMALAYIWGGYKNGSWSYSPYDKENYPKYRDEPKYWKAPCKGDEPLFVKETWRIHSGSRSAQSIKIEYAAGGELKKIHFRSLDEYDFFYDKWASDGSYRSPMVMPEEAARIFIVVKTVRCMRVQDAFKEEPGPDNIIVHSGFRYGCDFIAGWENAIKKKDKDILGYDANPFAWVIEYNCWADEKEKK